MAAEPLTNWGASLRETFRIFPEPDQRVRIMLEAEGKDWKAALAQFPYDKARAGSSSRGAPDPKRYRDKRQVLETVGLMFEDDSGVIHVSELGRTTLRWMSQITEANAPILGRHAAYALANCQLRNPTGEGRKYDPAIEVFPYAFIWRAMLALGGRISSDELNQVIFRTRNIADLREGIARIAEARVHAEVRMGEPIIEGDFGVDDRIIPWMSRASFGWLLIRDKKNSDDGMYRIAPKCMDIIREAARMRTRHRDFPNTAEYVEYISGMAALPKDVR